MIKKILTTLTILFIALLGATTFAVSVLSVDCTDTTTTGISQIECEALKALYNSTDGDNWTDNTN